MTTNIFIFESNYFEKKLNLMNRVLNPEYLLNRNFFGCNSLNKDPIFKSTCELQIAVLDQYEMLNKPKKVSSSLDIPLKFDTKLFLANLDKVERKMTKINEDYDICVDTAYDKISEYTKDVENNEEYLESVQNCNKGAIQRIDHLTNWLNLEGKNKMFCWSESTDAH